MIMLIVITRSMTRYASQLLALVKGISIGQDLVAPLTKKAFFSFGSVEALIDLKQKYIFYLYKDIG